MAMSEQIIRRQNAAMIDKCRCASSTTSVTPWDCQWHLCVEKIHRTEFFSWNEREEIGKIRERWKKTAREWTSLSLEFQSIRFKEQERTTSDEANQLISLLFSDLPLIYIEIDVSRPWSPIAAILLSMGNCWRMPEDHLSLLRVPSTHYATLTVSSSGVYSSPATSDNFLPKVTLADVSPAHWSSSSPRSSSL